MSQRVVSKSQFKPKALQWFREVEASGEELIITDHGRPVLKLVRFRGQPSAAARALEGSIVRYERPTQPVGEEDWEALR